LRCCAVILVLIKLNLSGVILTEDTLKEIESGVFRLLLSGPQYIIGLHAYLNSYPFVRYARRNVSVTVNSAFGIDTAREVVKAIETVFASVDLLAEVKVKDKELPLWVYLEAYSFTNVWLNKLREIAEHRISLAPESDRRILAVTSYVIKNLLGRYNPQLIVTKNEQGFIKVTWNYNQRSFSKAISMMLGYEVRSDVRKLIYKYLLGYQADRLNTYSFIVYPFAMDYIEKLAQEGSKYAKIPSEQEIETIIHERYEAKDFLTLSLLHFTSSQGSINKYTFLPYFYGMPFDHLCEASEIEGLFEDCIIHPLVFDKVMEAAVTIFGEILDKMITYFTEIFRGAGYRLFAKTLNVLSRSH